MKRYLILLSAALCLFAGCKSDKDDFKVKGTPYFSIVVLDDADIKIASLEEMTAQYTLSMTADGYSKSANANNHVSKATRFHVSSNLRWKVVPASGEPASWIHPFPESGEKDGIFFFKADRNIDPDNGRETLFNVLVDKGTGYYEPIEGLIRVEQDKSDYFLEMSAAKYNMAAAGGKINLRVKANVDWEYAIAPMADYATESTDWITDESEHVEGKQVDTLRLQVAANDGGIRGAMLSIRYMLDGNEMIDKVAITQYPANETSLEGFPVKWAVRVADNTFAATFPSDGTISPVSGSGMITFNNDAGKAADTKGNVNLDVSDNSPRATGVWPGDYCEFAAYSPVSAGTIAKIVFATRVSGTGQKYWRLEYRDGETWKIAGSPLTDPDVAGPDGRPVVYTHAMNSDGSTNILVESVAIFSENTDRVEFRFICAANYQASGAGPLSAPNGGTWRLSVDAASADDPYQPTISIVAAGNEVLVPATMSINPSYLVFEGKGSGTKQFTVTCNQAFTVASDASWVHLSASSAEPGENIPFTVTCDNNTETSSREATVTIKAGITRSEVSIIQGGASGGGGGGDLDPFVAVMSGSNVSIPFSSGTTNVTLLTNVDLSVQSSDTWLSASKVSETGTDTKTVVYRVSYSLNSSTSTPRMAGIRFYNSSANVDAVVVFTQAVNPGDHPTEFPIVWSMPSPVSNVKGQDYDIINPSGSYVYSDTHDGKLTVVRRSSSDACANSPTYMARSLSSEPRWGGKHCLLHYGIYKDDYWLFEVYNVKNVAGTYTIEYCAESSGNGPKYFVLEYSLDGASWTAIDGKSGSYGSSESFTYTYAIETASVVNTITKTFHLGAMSDFATLSIRARCVSISRVAGTDMALNHNATNRIGDHVNIEFTAD